MLPASRKSQFFPVSVPVCFLRWVALFYKLTCLLMGSVDVQASGTSSHFICQQNPTGAGKECGPKPLQKLQRSSVDGVEVATLSKLGCSTFTISGDVSTAGTVQLALANLCGVFMAKANSSIAVSGLPDATQMLYRLNNRI